MRVPNASGLDTTPRNAKSRNAKSRDASRHDTDSPDRKRPDRTRLDAEDETPPSDSAGPEGPDRAAHRSVQRALDQCLEEGQLHRLYQLAKSLNDMHHGRARQEDKA
jgi:hypothetical protein